MASIESYTDQIQNAVYGEEVRSSIINALNKVNEDNEAYQELNGSVASANAKKEELDAAVMIANTAKQNIEAATTAGNTAKTNLETATAAANTAKTNADTSKAALETATTAANTAKSNIDAALEDADEILTGVDDIKAYLGYIDEDIAGICVDYENKTFKRLAGAYEKTGGADFDSFAMFGGRRRCNVADDGTINAYYGDEGYTEDGSNGQVMVFQPKFYYKVVPLKVDAIATGIGHHLRKANYYVSTRAKAGFKVHPAFIDVNGNEVGYILLSAYEGSMYDTSASAYVNDGTDTATAIETGDLLCSVAGKKPISGLYKTLTKANLEILATNRTANWHLETIQAESANQLLMIVEMGMMNLQTAIGQGVVSITDNTAYNCASLTGSTSGIGNGTGQATETINEIGGTETTYNTAGKLSVTYRGVENPWSNLWKHINGVNIWGNGTMGGGQPFICDDFTFNESKHSDNYVGAGFTLTNVSGYISAMGYSEDFDWLFIPSECTGASNLPVGDYTYVTPDLNGYRIARLGGYWSSGGVAGGFCWSANNGVGHRVRDIGGRLVYVPTATV